MEERLQKILARAGVASRRAAEEMMVQGRVIYETMEGFWPQAREDASLPDFLREYGDIWTTKPKVLVSRTRSTADHDTRIIGGDDAIDRLATLRAETAGDIGVGGATLATQLLRAGLLDELLLFTHPVTSARAGRCSTTPRRRPSSTCSSSARSSTASRCTATPSAA